MAGREDVSDEDQDIDIESDDDDGNSSQGGNQFLSEADKKAHHNALERKRRDHIKESFLSLRDTIPTLRHEKTSRAQILKHATEYIQFMNKKNGSIQKDIDGMKRQNHYLKQQVTTAERVRSTSGGASSLSTQEPADVGLDGVAGVDEDSSDSEKTMTRSRRRKRTRVSR